MLCQNCGKNEAEVHFIQTINGQKTEILMCGECAAGKGLAFSPISFANFFQSFFDVPESVQITKTTGSVQRCSVCGISLDKLKSLGKAGCSECYQEFKVQMQSLIKSVQTGDVHIGKCPKNAKDALDKREIKALRGKLAEAVEKEEFEEAAKIRDLIKEIESRRENG